MNIIEVGSVTSPSGFRAAGVQCGIKAKTDKRDLALIYSEVPASAAAVYTKNRVKAAPLRITKRHLGNDRAQAVVANSGNANACTGETGLQDALRTAEWVSETLKIATEDVLVASTGVIGVPLPMDRIELGVREAALKLREDGGDEAAEAIMTTDLVPKKIAVEVGLSTGKVTIGGITKGSGMIAPDMATMLAFLTTDASIEPHVLAGLLRNSVERSFNMITVDGDMSTNDTVIVLANGAADGPTLVGDNADTELFHQGLDFVAKELAQRIVRDGEGATKFVIVRVRGARAFHDAKTVAMSVANSNLVKTAVFGEDPNWGRILAAVGYSGVEVDERKIQVSVGGVPIFHDGLGAAFDRDQVRGTLQGREVLIEVDLKDGSACAEVYTCDLSYDYVRINAEYTT